MRTLYINKRPGTFRGVPITTMCGYSQALAPKIIAQLRSVGLVQAPEPIAYCRPPPKALPPPRPRWRCAAHGELTSSDGECPYGCCPEFLRPIAAPPPPHRRPWYEDDLEPPLVERRSPERSARDKVPTGNVLTRRRDRRGRFLVDEIQPSPPRPDEQMTETQVRTNLWRLFSHLPTGSKAPLSRLCGYRGPWALQTFRGVAKGRAMLPETGRRRISRVLRQIERGELVLVKTAQLSHAGRPVYVWERRPPKHGSRARAG